MDKWEYKFIDVKGGRDGMLYALNQEGKAGWELAAHFGMTLLILKRRRTDSEP